MKPRLRVRVAGYLLLAVACCTGFELLLRAATWLMWTEPAASLMREAARIPRSNTRMYSCPEGCTSIILPPKQKADIVVIGDSIPFGTLVSEKDTFPRILADRLHKTVINLAVGSQSPNQYHRLVEIASRYEPRTMIYSVFSNDFNWGAWPDAPTLQRDRGEKNLPGDEKLVIATPTPRDRIWRAAKVLTNLSLGFQLLQLKRRGGDGLVPVPWKDATRYLSFRPFEYWDSYLDWQRERIRETTGENARLAELASDFAKSWNGKLIVVFIPHKEMVYAPVVDEATRAKILSLDQERTIDEFGSAIRARRLPYENLTEALRAEAKSGKKLYFTIDGHLDESGHAAVADYLAPRI